MPRPAAPGPADPPRTLPLPPGDLPDGGEAGKGRRKHWRRLPEVGPVVGEAMAVNAVLRAFSGYILFLLAFLLRSVDLGTVFHHPVSHNFALGALALGLSAGSLASMVLGSFFRSRGTAADHVHRADHRAGGDRRVRLGVRPLGGGRGRVHRDLLRQPGQARPGLDRRPRDRRRDQVLDVLRLRDPQPGRQRGRRPGRGGRVHPRQRPGGPGDRGRRPRRRAGPARRAAQAAGPGRRRADAPAARAARREPVRARCPWRRPSAAPRSAWLPSAPGACRAGRRPRSRRAASSGPR